MKRKKFHLISLVSFDSTNAASHSIKSNRQPLGMADVRFLKRKVFSGVENARMEIGIAATAPSDHGFSMQTQLPSAKTKQSCSDEGSKLRSTEA